MRIIGIDPGYDIVGWSIIENELKVLDYGIIKTDPGKPFDERLLVIHNNLNSIIKEFSPDSAAIEKLFFQNNTTTAMKVANAIGVIILTLKMNGIDFCEYTPTQVKQAITGFGKADKAQMQFVMAKLLNLKKIEGPDDAADALAIATCHSMKN